MKTTKYNSELLFSPSECLDPRWTIFLNTDLGRLYSTIPFQKLSLSFPAKKHHSGVQPIFPVEGGIGLMFLKSYYGVSDQKLIALINGNWMLQMFCGIRLGLGQMIRDRGIISRWRVFLGKHLNIDNLQQILVGQWRSQMKDTTSNVCDATCYESYVRYPTDVKLLWEGIEWLHMQMMSLCSFTKTRHPRNKYRTVKSAYLSYARKRRKSYKMRRRINRRLLHLLHKLLGQISPLIGCWKMQPSLGDASPVKANFFKYLRTLKKMYQQQQLHFDRPDVPISNRIVSLFKPYLRPIVRGKENKRVEFGKKVHKTMVDGLSFIEYWDYEAFHEGNRTIKTIWMHRRYFGLLRRFDGDQIYATNKNRKYCSQNSIFTGFKRKGRAGKNEKQNTQMRKLLNKERATVLEGSFGNEKNHYNLTKIKARTDRTENVWIFFGIMCANAMKIAKRTNAPP